MHFFVSPFSSFFAGFYTFPIPVGINIEIKVDYSNHTFSLVRNSKHTPLVGMGASKAFAGIENVPEQYFYIEKSMSDLDYEDTTTALINVEVAGGLCNRTLGDAIINIKRDLCPKYLRPVLVETFQTPLILPSHQLTVEFGQLMGVDVNFNLEVGRYLRSILNNSAVIDLRNVTDNTQLETTVRFEYHPAPTLKVEITNTSRPTCSNPLKTAPLVASQLANTTVTVYITEEFPGVLACDYVPGSLNLTSNFGEVGSEIPELTTCQGTPCNLTVIHDELPASNTTFYVNARVEVNLLIGYPVLFPPYSKNIFIRMPTRGHVDTTKDVAVVVTGLKLISNAYSIQIPEYMPLLLLYDPPGSGSFAEYDNAVSYSHITANHDETSDVFAFHFEIGLGGAFRIGSCKGLGFEVCDDLIKLNILALFHTDVEISSGSTHDTANTAIIGFSYSYTTSDGVNAAVGNYVDVIQPWDDTMVMVPALNVVYSISLNVQFDPAKCKATGKQVTTWSLDSPANYKVFAWESLFQINNVLVPAIQALLDEQNELPASKDRNSRIDLLSDALKGWTKVNSTIVSRYEDAGKEGHGGLMKASVSAANSVGLASLVAESLLVSTGPDFARQSIVKNNDGTTVNDLTQLRSTSAFTYVGGGSSLTLTEDSERDYEEHKGKSNTMSYANGFSISANIEGAFILFETAADFTWGHEHTTASDDVVAATTATTNLFTFYDGDFGDAFDVQVCLIDCFLRNSKLPMHDTVTYESVFWILSQFS
jgi:hypothetical protein